MGTVEVQQQFVTPVQAWYMQYAAPVIEAMYAFDVPMARARALSAWASLEESNLSQDHRRAAAYKLTYLEFQLDKLDSPDEVASHFACARLRLRERPAGDLSAAMQALVTLQLMVNGERRGLCTLERETFCDAFNAVPEESRDLEFWFHVASWAFQHRDLGFLEQAYEEFLMHPSEFVDQFPFQRVKLMYRLLRRELQHTEVLAFLKLLSVMPELDDFRQSVLPELKSCGMYDDAIAAELALADERLATATPQAPVSR